MNRNPNALTAMTARFLPSAALALAFLCAGASAQTFSHDASGNLVSVSGTAAPVLSIISQPAASLSYSPGNPVSLTVSATGGTLTYQWKKGTVNVPGANGPTLFIPAASAADAGSYTVVVSNGSTSVTSNPAVVSVQTDVFTDVFGATGSWRQSGSIAWKRLTAPDYVDETPVSIGVTGAFNDETNLYTTLQVTQPSELRFRVKASYQLKLHLTTPSKTVEISKNFSTYEWTEVLLHFPSAGVYEMRWEFISGSSGGFAAINHLTCTPSVDSDSDGLPDSWEMKYFNTLANNANGDEDGDNNSNLIEYQDMTMPDNRTEFLPSDKNAFIRRVYATIEGNGSISRSLAQPAQGYDSNDVVTFTAVPGAGQVFAGWEFIEYAYAPRTFYKNPIRMPLGGGSKKLKATFTPEVPVAQALDGAGLTWSTGGALVWQGQGLVTNDGQDAVTTAPLQEGATGATGWIETTVTGPVTFSATQRLQRPYGLAGKLEFTINGQVFRKLDSDQGWDQLKYYLPAGQWTLRWTATLNSTGFDYDYSPRVLLDQVSAIAAVDTDNDGLSDQWEQDYFSTLTYNGTQDYDNDGIPDATEYLDLTRPTDRYDGLHALTILTNGSGTVAKSPDAARYPWGTAIQITAVPASGWVLDHWEGGAYEIQSPSTTLYIDKATTLTAVFAPADTLAVALDQTGAPFTNSIPGWTKVTDVTHDGVDAARSPLRQGSNSFTMAVTGPRVMSFWWKNTTANNYSSLSFSGPDGYLEARGPTDWQRKFVTIPAGDHTLTWGYSANVLGDLGYIDDVRMGIDNNGDGLPDDWKLANLGAGATTAGTDSDSDNNSNLIEWSDGTNPASAASAIYRLIVRGPDTESVAVSPRQLGYAPGTVVTLTPQPAGFTGWSGSASGTASPLSVTMNSSKDITAIYNALADATDNTRLAWTTGGVSPWTGTDLNMDYRNQTAARSGPVAAAGAENWIQGTVTGPGTLTFKAYSRFDTSSGKFAWTLDGEAAGQSYSYYGTDGSIRIGDGTHVIRWTYKADSSPEEYEMAMLDNVVFTPDKVVPFDVALDTTGLTWNAGSPAKWIGTDYEPHDGVDCIRTLAGLGHGQKAEIQTTVTVAVPTTLSFWWDVSSDFNDYLKFYVNGSVVRSISGFGGWSKVVHVLPAGTHTLKFAYEKDASNSMFEDMAWVDEVRLYVPVSVPLADALDGPGLAWTTGGTNGSSGWAGFDQDSHDGVDAARSGTTTNSGSSWIQTSVTGPGTLSFWWKVSCENPFDTFNFAQDGSSVGAVTSLTGNSGWRQVTLSVPAGSHTYRWTYLKDGFGTGGEDTAWLDQVSFTGAAGFTTWADNAGLTPSERGHLTILAGDGLPNLLKYAFNLAPKTSIQGGARYLTPGTGTSGLPSVSMLGTGAAKRVRLEFIRRRNAADLTYSPRFSSNLQNWSGGGTPVVTAIDANWERVVVEGPASATVSFGRVEVTGQ